MEKRVQAKHIDERAILQFIGDLDENLRATHWQGYANSIPSDAPPKVLLAKLAAMKRRGLIDGCACGCRGDWQITNAGCAALENER